MAPQPRSNALGHERRADERARGLLTRIARAARALVPEQRLAALAAIGLLLTMFLPWYTTSTTQPVNGQLKSAGYSTSAFGAFSFVEAAVLLVSAAVLLMLFARGERRAFHLPGGDGFVLTLAGVWCAVLIFYRMLDKPGTTGNGHVTATIGLQWGIFVALAAAITLAVAGQRVRAAHRPEPPLLDTRPAPRERPELREPREPRSPGTEATPVLPPARPLPTKRDGEPGDPPRRRPVWSENPLGDPPAFEEPTTSELPPRPRRGRDER